MFKYSEFHQAGLLEACKDYAGDDFTAVMAKTAADPMTQEWFDVV